MALHGEIKVNGQEVARWEAIRIETGDPNWYRCDVEWTPEAFVRHSTGQRYPVVRGGRTEHAQRHTFSVQHRYEDGATVLAAKVLTECMGTPHAHADDEQHDTKEDDR